MFINKLIKKRIKDLFVQVTKHFSYVFYGIKFFIKNALKLGRASAHQDRNVIGRDYWRI